MDLRLIESTNYKEFILRLEAEDPRYQRGFRSRLAEHVGCQNAFVSQVLGGRLNFSLEQALLVAEFFGFSEKERKYFLLLVEHERAGTAKLKEYFNEQLASLRQEGLDLQGRIGTDTVLSFEDQAEYYSRPLYSLIHMWITIPGHRTVPALVKALREPESVVRPGVDFLLRTGILVQKGGELTPGKTVMHLGRNSPLIINLHANWRNEAIRSLRSGANTNLHYSTLSSLSHEDFERLQAQMVELINSYVEKVKASPEETVACFTMDFFKV